MLGSIKLRLKHLVKGDNVEFLRHSRNYISAELFANALNFLSIPIFTRLLSPDDYGTLAIYGTIISILSIFLTLNMSAGIKQQYLRHPETYETALGSNLIFIAGYNVIAICFLIAFRERLASFFDVKSDIFIFAILVSSIGVLNTILLGYYQGSQNSKKYAFQQAIINSSTLVIAISIMMFLEEQRYLGRVYAQLIVTVIMAVYSGWLLVKIANFAFDWHYVRYTLSFSIPLIPHTISGFVLTYFDRIVIQQLTDTSKTGLYSFAYNVGMAMNVVVMATAKSWQPIFYNNYGSQNYISIEQKVSSISKYIYFAAVSLILFSKEIVMILAAPEYYSALNIVPIIIFGYVMVYWYTLFFQYAGFRKRTGLISLNTAISAATNVGLNYYFIPLYGYQVAAYTTLTSYCLLFVLHFVNAKYVLKEHVFSLKCLLPGIGWVVLALLIGYLTNNRDYLIGLVVKLSYIGFIVWLFFVKNKNMEAQNG